MSPAMGQHVLVLSLGCCACVVLCVHVLLFPLFEGGGGGAGAAAGGRGRRRGRGSVLGDYEQSLCSGNLRPLPPPPAAWRRHCPRDGIVSVSQGGRLGNQMWEYASVWAVARRTGLEPYVPRCIRRVLDEVFEGLSVPPLAWVAHCPADWARAGSITKAPDQWAATNQTILLPKFAVLPELVLAWPDDIRQEFRFRRRLFDTSQQVLRTAAARATNATTPTIPTTFVGVHVRRTDYQNYLLRTRGASLAGPGYFLSAMDYFRSKFANVTSVAFLVVSDDPAWCRHHLVNDRPDVFVVSKAGVTSAGQDLAIMAACNHSIIDYGTFGVWGAILARGETVLYNISRHSSTRISELLPGWHVIN